MSATTPRLTSRLRFSRTPAAEAPWARSERHAPPWAVLCDSDVVLMPAPTRQALRQVPSGRQVALAVDRPLARPRLRRLARRCDVVVERELIVVPTTAHPIAAVDDEESAVRHFWRSVVAVPPGITRAALVATVVLRVARVLPWRWTGAVAPGRVVIGRRR
jgi:hypothetical protein